MFFFVLKAVGAAEESYILLRVGAWVAPSFLPSWLNCWCCLHSFTVDPIFQYAQHSL